MKILYVSDSCTVNTGYGRVSQILCQAFHDAGHEVVQIGWGYQGEKHNFPFRIIPCFAQRENFGEDRVASFIREERPDILFTLGDPWMLQFIPELEERAAVTWVSYFPIDGYPVPKAWHSWMKNIDVPIVFSKFSQKLVEEIIGFNPPLIYHGVKSNIYIPLDKALVKQEAMGTTDKFVVGTVARNQPRKNLPALIKAFADFAKNKDDAILYLHTQIRDVGWNLDEIIERFELQEKVFASQRFNAMVGVPESDLVKIYNMFDIFVLPTMSEGFGLPIMEAQSCGTPVLVTNFSACTELVVDRQELIKVKDTLIMGRSIEQAIVDTDDITRKLEYFYHDWKKNDGKKLKEFGSKGRELAESFDWSIQVKHFMKLLEQVEPRALKREKAIRPTFFRIS